MWFLKKRRWGYRAVFGVAADGRPPWRVREFSFSSSEPESRRRQRQLGAGAMEDDGRGKIEFLISSGNQ
jgi:hypothetical protein